MLFFCFPYLSKPFNGNISNFKYAKGRIGWFTLILIFLVLYYFPTACNSSKIECNAERILYFTFIPNRLRLKKRNIIQSNIESIQCTFHMLFTRDVLVFLKFGNFSCELKETESSGATEIEIWIGNFNVKVWKSTEQKLHKIWHSLKFSTNLGKRAHPGCKVCCP